MSSGSDEQDFVVVGGNLYDTTPPPPIPTPIVPPEPAPIDDHPDVPSVGQTDPVKNNLFLDLSIAALNTPQFVPNDPLYSSQWHISMMGNMEEVWNEYTGDGVTVGVYDDGFEFTHADLAANYNASAHLVHAGETFDPTPVQQAPDTYGNVDAHGTAVGGLIGAVGDNSIGVTGGGFEATLTGVNFLVDVQSFRSSDTSTSYWNRYDAAFAWAGNFDIMNNSWGSTPLYSQDATTSYSKYIMQENFEDISATGRGGLGTLIVHATGNDNANANGDGTNAFRQTISIAATDQNGDAESYTNWGSGVLVAAPAGAVTTDLSGSNGYNGSSGTAGDYADDFNGTSAATPVTSGVLSLVLEANDNLGWRDVHNILAESAALTGSNYGAPATNYEDSSWGNTGASNWNGGGHAFHLSYGYGLVNPLAAVRMAEAWGDFYSAPYTSANEANASGDYTGSSVSIPDNSSTNLDVVVSSDIEVETALVTVELSHTDSEELQLSLVTPNGAEIPLFDQEVMYDYYNYGFYYGEDAYPWIDSNVLKFFETTTTWTFEVVALRGYESAGTWKLKAGEVDSDGTSSGTINDVDIAFFGAPLTTDDVHTLTNDFPTLKNVDSGRDPISDADGGTDWLNAVAVYNDITVNLQSGISVGGTSWATLDGSIENIATSDGDDDITGTAGDNKVLAGRGDDTVNALGGDDEVDGQAGNDTIVHSDGANTYIGGDGTDQLSATSQTSGSVSWSVDGNSQLVMTDGSSSSIVSDTIESIAFSNESLTYAAAYSLANGSNAVPVFTSGTSVNFAENGTGVAYTAQATDADADTLTYALVGGADQSAFTLDPNSGELSFNSSPDFEGENSADSDNDYHVDIRVSDGNGGTATQSVTVSVTDVSDNSAPVFTSGTSVNFAENGTGVAYTAQATDADADTLTYALVGGADQSAFTLDPNSGELSFNSSPDFEGENSADSDNDYHVDIRVSDGNGGTATQSVTVSVTDVSDNSAPVFTSGTSVNFAENGTGVAYTAQATDADADTLTYALVGGADQSAFTLDPNSGELSFNSSPDFEGENSADSDNDYHVDIRVSDGNGGTATQSVTVSVTDVSDNSAPVFTSGTSVNFAENGTGVAYTAQATDADADTLTYALVGGADQSAFTLDPNSGELSFNSSPDFEGENSADSDNDYHVDIRVSDGNGGTATQTVTVSVTDVDDSASTQVVYNGVTYELIPTLATFEEAETDAYQRGGYLATLTAAGEAAAVVNMLDTYFQANPSAYYLSYAEDGGDAAYVWAGGGDFFSEGDWIWSNGQPFSETYTNWGSGHSTHPGEPDDFGNAQDALAIALEPWPWQSPPYIGDTGEWNDVNQLNSLYYVVEYGTDQQVETDGDVDLRTIPWTGYEIEPSGSSSIVLTDSQGSVISPSNNLIHAEDDGDSGFIVLEESVGRGNVLSYSVRHFDGGGEEAGKATAIGTTEALLVDWEDDFEVDLNGDSTIGHTYTVVESDGDVVLSSSTSGGYSINHSSGGEIDLVDSRGRLIAQSSKYDLLHAEENAGGGYDVLVNTPKRGVDNYSVRHFDSAGEEVGKATSIGTTEARLVDWEDDFEVDLNGDLTIGHTYNVVESDGDVVLSSSTSGGYSINHSSGGEIDLVDSRGRLIAQSSKYDLLHAEENAGGGYDVLVNTPKRGVDNYSVRHFDSAGEEVGKATSIGTTEARLVDWEDDFEVDLNGDLTIGHTYNVVESDGDVVLSSSTSGGYSINHSSGGEIDLVDSRGRLIAQSSKYDLLHAEENAGGGYDVLVNTPKRGADNYSVRHFDSAGEEVGKATSIGTTEARLVDWEDDFEVDLNGDLTIGHTYNVVESDGDVVLSSSTSGGYSINHSSGGEIDLVDSRGRLIAQSSKYDLLHAEENVGGGYDVLVNTPKRGADNYSVRHFDSAGEEVGKATSIGTTEARLVDWEDDFEVDLNGDLTIGHTYNVVESDGDVVLSSSTSGGYSINHSSGGEINLVDSRGRLIAQSSKYDLLHAEENAGGGYDVLVNTPKRGADNYSVRHFDSAGEEVGKATSIGTTEARLVDWEDDFEVDLNGDLTIGHTYNVVESDGDVVLSSSTSGGYSINHSSGGEIDLVDSRGRLIAQSSKYDLLHAEENVGGGYDVLVNTPKRGADNYSVRHFDSAGEEVGKATSIGTTEARLVDWEDDFEVDLNGDLTIGHTYTVVESDGDVVLSSSTSGGYSINHSSGGEIDLVDSRGRLIAQSSKYDLLHAEENVGGGYDVLVNTPKRGADNYSVRHFDSAGEEVSSATSLGTSEDRLVEWEDDFEVDLNGNSVIGSSFTSPADLDVI